jgi:hypothetical protein
MYIKAIISPNKLYNKVIIHSHYDKVDLLLYDNETDFFPSLTKNFDSIENAIDWAEHIGEDNVWELDENDISKLEISRWENTTIFNILYQSLVYISQVTKKVIVSFWNTLSKYVPGTWQFSRRHLKKQIQIRKQKVSKFQEVKTLPPEKKKALTATLRHRETPIAENEMILEIIGNLEITIQFSILLFLLFGGSVLLVNHLFSMKLGFWVGATSLFFAFIEIWLIIVLMKINSFLNNFINTSLFREITAITPVLFLLIYSLGFYYYPDTLRSYLSNFWTASFFVSGLNLSFFLTLTVGLSDFTHLILKPLAKHRLRIQHPESVLVDELLRIVLQNEQHHNVWNISYKQSLISNLESIAIQLENNILYKLQYRDNNTKFWVKHEIQKISAAIRETKKMIILPERQSKDVFLQTLTHFLEIAILGTWGELPKIENPKEISLFQNLGISFPFIVRTAFSIIIPIAGWMFFQFSPLAIKSPLSDYVTIGILAWSALSLLAAIDPTYPAKISAIRELTQIFPFSNTKKE